MNSFFLLSATLFLTIVYRIWTAASVRERLLLYLLFFLYFALFSYPLLWSEAPGWFHMMNLSLFAGGQMWLLVEPVLTTFQKGRSAGSHLRGLKKEKGGLYEVIVGGHLLAQAKLGALIAIERKQSLDAWSGKGVRIDAELSREILFSVFTPPGTLHDGAAIIKKDRLIAGGVIVPLTQATHFPKELGTRHRAAVGFSEATDAVCLVISEESGSMSIADRGTLYYDIPFEKLPEFLEKALRFQLHRSKSKFQTLEPVKA